MDEVDEPIPVDVIQRNEEKKEKTNKRRTWRDYSETKDYKRETGGARPWPDVADWETPGIEILFLTRTHTHTHTHIHTLSLSSRVRAVCCRSFFLFWIVKPRPSLPLNNPAIPHMLDIYSTLYTSLYGSYTNMSRPPTPPIPPGRRKRRVGQKISSTRHVWNPAPALNRDYTGLVELLGRYMENKSPACDYYYMQNLIYLRTRKEEEKKRNKRDKESHTLICRTIHEDFYLENHLLCMYKERPSFKRCVHSNILHPIEGFIS
jgi:hypothetical protein